MDLVAIEINWFCKKNACTVDDVWHTIGMKTAKHLKDNELVWGSVLEGVKIFKIRWSDVIKEHH